MGKFRNVWMAQGGPQVQCLDCGQILPLGGVRYHLCTGPPDATVRCGGCGAEYTGKPKQVLAWLDLHHCELRRQHPCCGDPVDGLEPTEGSKTDAAEDNQTEPGPRGRP